ncbi:MAG: DUF4421 domain-containing protein [Prevotella sp.]|nr:DUF4421 domain-containing protein [Prevotella sp.]
MKRIFIIFFISIFVSTIASAEMADSLAVEEKPSFFERVVEVVKDFSRIDTNYIEPQHYNFSVMLQNTNTFESYTLRNKQGQELVLSPGTTVRVGPYFGWRWLFLGYTFDISHFFDGHHRHDWNLSFYSNQVGVDLFFRQTGDDYKIRVARLSEDFDIPSLKDVSFGGFSGSVKGFNLYYILNHKKFSYPAAFNQSTCQKISCGSPLIGIGYTKHTLNLDASKLNDLVEKYTNIFGVEKSDIDNLLDLPNAAAINYTDVSASGGYAYNWVFAKNWLAAASLSLAVGYKYSTGDLEREGSWLREFSFRNFNLDGVGRFGLVWNNTRWYAGSSVIFHSYYYAKSQFSANTFFGNWNIYLGYNFGKRKN